MQSPFPGMDPYIEACQLWDDFHHDLLLEIKGALAAQLPAGYVVRGSERTYLVMGPAEGQRQEHRFWSDVSVASTGTAAAGTATVSPAVPASASEVNPVSIPPWSRPNIGKSFLRFVARLPKRSLSHVSKFFHPRISILGAKVGGSSIASGALIWQGKLTMSRSTCYAAAGACPWRAHGRTAPIICLSAERMRRPSAKFGGLSSRGP
jgi:hypothetical protein